MASPLLASLKTKKVLLLVLGTVALTAAFLTFRVGSTPAFVKNGIPIPFMEQGTNLQGRVTYLTKRNNIDVYDVTFTNNEAEETLTEDKIYLVHIPNDNTITESPIDIAMTLAGTNDHSVDYYGYRYSDAAATTERRDIAAVRFKDRFPGQFFASAKARAQDTAHGNALAAFEAKNGVQFLRTDAPNGVRIDPAGSLYVIVANEQGGIDMNPRSLTACGNGDIDGAEECDDGNTVDTDSCRNDCTVGFPIPFGSGSTNNRPSVTLAVRSHPTTDDAVAGQSDIALLKFDVSADAEAVRLQRLVFRAEAGALSNVTSYALWKDTNGDGTVDARVNADIDVTSTLLTSTFVADAGSFISPNATVTYEVRADVPAPLVGDTLKLAFAVSENDYVAAKLEGGSFPLIGIQTDTSCSQSSCGIKVVQKPATLWTLLDHAIVCGDGAIDGSEVCDDDNTTSGDGCSSACAIESGFSCTGTPSVCTLADQPIVCGNGEIDTDETCDDGNQTLGDGCSTQCTVESDFHCSGVPSECVSYVDFVKNLADVNHNGIVSDTEALLLTLDVVDAPDQPYADVSRFDIDNDGDVDNADTLAILTQLDVLAP